jgi:hypothetical protein
MANESFQKADDSSPVMSCHFKLCTYDAQQRYGDRLLYHDGRSTEAALSLIPRNRLSDLEKIDDALFMASATITPGVSFPNLDTAFVSSLQRSSRRVLPLSTSRSICFSLQTINQINSNQRP